MIEPQRSAYPRSYKFFWLAFNEVWGVPRPPVFVHRTLLHVFLTVLDVVATDVVLWTRRRGKWPSDKERTWQGSTDHCFDFQSLPMLGPRQGLPLRVQISSRNWWGNAWYFPHRPPLGFCPSKCSSLLYLGHEDPIETLRVVGWQLSSATGSDLKMQTYNWREILTNIQYPWAL